MIFNTDSAKKTAELLLQINAIKLNPKTTNIMDKPGASNVHGANWMKSRASANIFPHSAVGGCAPSPKNPNAAASKIAVPNPNVD